MNVSIIGCGSIAKVHASALTRLGVTPGFACSRTLRSAGSLEHHGYSPTTSLDDALRSDAVIICTPNDTHYDIAKRALLKKKHVFLEKPMAEHLHHAKELADLSSGSTLMIGYVLRFASVFQMAKQLMPEIGKITSITDTRKKYKSIKPWWQKRERFLLAFQGSHAIDIIDYLTSSVPRSVTCNMRTLHDDFMGEDEFDMKIRYDDFTVNISHSFVSDENMNQMVIRGKKGVMRITDFKVISLNGKVIFEDDNFMSAFDRQMEHFIKNSGNIQTSLCVQKIIEAGYLSKGDEIMVGDM